MKCLQLQIASCLLCLTKNMGKIMFKYSWKYLFLCSTEEKIACRLETIWRWESDYRFLIFWWMTPLMPGVNDRLEVYRLKPNCECELLFTKLYMRGKQKWAACDCGLLWGWISSSCSVPPVSPHLTSPCPGQLHSRPRRSEAAICLDKPLILNFILLGFTWWQNPLFNSFTPHRCAL